jgi:septum site-determining protein MinC
MANSPVELKIVSAVAVCAILRDADVSRINTALSTLSQSGSLFDKDLCVIDVGQLENHDAIPWHEYRKVLRSYGLHAVAVRNARAESTESILAAGLVIDPVRSPAALPDLSAPEIVADAESRLGACPPMIIEVPVRAGQRIYARGCDLIVTQIVNNGAEIIADGNIHVYAPLRGRALAGASGDMQARIFTLCMEAELVSIAGIYRNFESGLPTELYRQASEVSLSGEALNIRPLAAV